MADGHDYSGLTDEELAHLADDSVQLPGEDASTWAARARSAADRAAAVAAERRAAAAAETEAEETPA